MRIKTIDVEGYESVEVSTTNVSTELYVNDELVLDLYPHEREELLQALHYIPETEEPDEPESYPLWVVSSVAKPRVKVRPHVTESIEDEAEAMERVLDFVEAEVPFFIKYQKEDGEVVFRNVSGYEVRPVLHSPSWARRYYVIGWDHGREDVRNFRLDRIEGIAPAPVEFRPEEV